MNIWENTVLTDKGRALLVKLVAGSSLHITRAATGTGYVTPGLLAQQTAVSGEKQALNFRPVGYPEEGKCAVTCNLTNDDLTAGYLAKQIGLYATDPDNGEILFMLSQAPSEKGTEVPSASEMPGYTAEWTFNIQYGQADGVIVTVNPAGTVSREEMDAELAKKAPRQFVMQLTYGADMENCTIDKSFAELQEAYQAGSQIRLVDQSGMEYEMVAFGADYMAYFVHQMTGERYLVGFRANGKVSYSSTTPYTDENPPTAAAVGAKGSNSTAITSGSIKTWAETQKTSTSVGVYNKVTDLPETGCYWIVDLIVATNGLWRKLTATKTNSDGTAPTTYECSCMSDTWSEWIKIYNSDNLEITLPEHKHTKSDITDFPTSMTPTAHTHTKSDITDFPTAMTPTSHTHSKSDITDFPTAMTPTAHNQAASTITAGTFAGKVVANPTAAATVKAAQVRDIYAGTDDMTAGTSSLASGTLYLVYE